MTTIDWFLTSVAGVLVVLAFILLIRTTIPPNDAPSKRRPLQVGACILLVVIGLLMVVVIAF